MKGEFDRASEALASFENAEPKASDSVRDEITAERVRLQMDQKRPTEAVDLVLKTRGRRKRLTGELWLLQTRALIALREVSLTKKQETLAEDVSKEIVTTIGRCDEQVGGYWSRRCRQMWDNAQTAQKYGVELDSLMQQARNDFTAGRIDAALAEYATAEKAAVKKSQAELAMELGFTRASILLDGIKLETAAAEFFRLSSEYPTMARAAKSHLLGTYCLGRLYDEKKTQARREAYSEALDRHFKDYPGDATINDARFLKAQFEEQRLQATLALPFYLQVASDHSRALDAMSGAARCYESVLRRMNERHLASDQLEREAIARLTTFLTTTGDSVDQWKAAHADIALRLATILLMGVGERSSANGASGASGNQSENPQALSEIARCQQAERWLVRVISFADRKESDAVASDVSAQLRRRAAPSMIVALAGGGKTAEAEQKLDSLSASPAEMLAVLDRLTQFVATMRGEERVRLARLQFQLAERLSARREQLSTAEGELLDRSLTKAYALSGQFKKAAELAQRVAEHSLKDLGKQREIAKLFDDVENPEAQTLAKQCWRRVESLTKAGSAEWMTARLAVLKACVRLNQFEEGRKLMQVTRVLYPELGGEPLKKRFETVEKELQVGKSN